MPHAARSPRFGAIRVLGALAAITLIAACRPDRGCPGSLDVSGPYADLVREIAPRLEQSTGLCFTAPPKVEEKSPEEVRQFVERQLRSERARREITSQGAVYKRLGLVPDTLDLYALLERLYAEQIVGYYDPKTKALYLVKGARRDLLKTTLSHELVHALQDQHVNVDSIQSLTGDADRLAAAQAVIEGQAVYEQFAYQFGGNFATQVQGSWQTIKESVRDNQQAQPIFAAAPLAIRESLIFPYLGGAEFVRKFVARRPAKTLLSQIPVSTKQLLNDDAFFGTAPDAPTPVTITVTGGTTRYDNGFGEFESRLIFFQHLRDEAVAARTAHGIDGDRYALVETPKGDAIAWASVWDTPVMAGNFALGLADVVRKRYKNAVRNPEGAREGDVRRFDIAARERDGARTVTIATREIDGRPVIIFTDAPAGVTLTSAVTLGASR
ncbi:MAG: hypothetical protein MUF00_07480 [Gemmatimonadaceae bacterium]|jgi:hypothetical protein|nr:hypothetical protein [Gemmatimonadaceae bacterium]